MAVSERREMTLSLKKPDGDRVVAEAALEPTLVIDEGGDKFTLTTDMPMKKTDIDRIEIRRGEMVLLVHRG